MNEELLKSLNSAIDTAIQQLVAIDTLSKGDVSLQEAKLRPESENGSVPGHDGGAVDDSALNPEDAKKADDADAKKESKDYDDEDEDEDLDDEEAEKLKAKIKKYEEKKAAKAVTASAPAAMSKSDIEQVTEALTKSIVTRVEEAMQKSFSDRLAQVEGLLEKLVKAPQPRQSASGLAPLAKSSDDIAPAAATVLSKNDALEKLFAMQKSGDTRVDSTVIARVDMNDFSVLQERGINLK